MTHTNKIYKSIVVQKNQRTAAQLAAQLRTTPNAVAARVSEIRDAGYVIDSIHRTDTKGRTKSFYRVGKPSLELIAAGRELQKMEKHGGGIFFN